MAIVRASFAAAAAAPADAGAQVLGGHVVEGSTPVADAAIAVADVGGADTLRLVTDSAGAFRVVLPRAAAYVLSVQHIAYVPYRSAPLEVGRGESIDVEIRLGRSVVPLDPLVIIGRASPSGRLAGYRERLRRGSASRFITRAEIERRPLAPVSDLLRTVPGVSVLTANRGNNPNAMAVQLIAMRGAVDWCMPGLFLDGIRIGQSSDHPIDDLLAADLLEGIEVYPSAASMPIEYQQGGTAACGAVLFWTREGEPGGTSGWKRWAFGIAGLTAMVLLTVFGM